MNKEKTNLQESFLNHVRREKVSVTIFLVNGVKLQGVITWFDNFALLLNLNGQAQLVYKHAISTIMPAQPVVLYGKGDSDADTDASTDADKTAPKPKPPTPPSTQDADET